MYVFTGTLGMNHEGQSCTPIVYMKTLSGPLLQATSSTKTQSNAPTARESPLGRPSMKSLFLKEKSYNNSIKTYPTSPNTKRTAASNENLEDLSSPVIRKPPVNLQFSVQSLPLQPPAGSPGLDTSLDNTIVDMDIMCSTGDIPIVLGAGPPLDSPNIDLQMRNFLLFMLYENIALNE